MRFPATQAHHLKVFPPTAERGNPDLGTLEGSQACWALGGAYATADGVRDAGTDVSMSVLAAVSDVLDRGYSCDSGSKWNSSSRNGGTVPHRRDGEQLQVFRF